jgi:hypothetical protein
MPCKDTVLEDYTVIKSQRTPNTKLIGKNYILLIKNCNKKFLLIFNNILDLGASFYAFAALQVCL